MQPNLMADCDKNMSNKKLACFSTPKRLADAVMMHSELKHPEPKKMTL
jgi:hypothetical protein